MTENKDHLTVYYNEPAQLIPLEAKDIFVELINSAQAPSIALKFIMDKYALERLDHSITLAAFESCLPGC